MENDDTILKVKNTKYTLKESPYYEDQNNEIELLKNIIPDKLTIESDDPNYVLEINVTSSLENPEKEYILKVFLNYFYPEKSPRFQIYEKNDFLQEYRKKEITARMNKVLEENLGGPTIYQLYECAVEFADEEEERRAKIIEEYNHQLKCQSVSLGQVKLYKDFEGYNVTDIVVLQNNYLILACCEDIYNPCLRIIDEKYEKEIYELELLEKSEHAKYQCKINKLVLYNKSSTEDYLYIVGSDKIIYLYKINYLKKTNKKTGLNITIEQITHNSGYNFFDLIILNEYNCFLFLCKDEIIFWNQNDKFIITTDSIVKQINNNEKYQEIFQFNKNLFVLTNPKNKKLIFLKIKDNFLNDIKWGKKINICCSKEKNYMVKIDENNLLFWNINLKTIAIIYIPTQEIVTLYEINYLHSIIQLNSSIFLCSNKGIDEIDFKNSMLNIYELKLPKDFKSLNFIKPLGKGYLGLANSEKFMLCK